ncbi:MAG: pilus assembly protein CpaF [Candidatus Aquicultor secundus]|uniref:Pilus assembly protein CpaF n=1 Tax=Candidatus Aquicultor secundus TaxID=1973895 RepID=A0A2M7T7T0_9ACTN|nr:CpaF family protein [Candidatus Aquicultor secundus]NCO65389.1 CpaF family protein [Solirubrobacter sp.]OIO85592.1 MAG: pilus assembly protein CpaF [Candidatus Aquicultor secundus]PIW21598.1 MAG: pilus assembly protein CpaF [Candidatus Aquicultor secundus]PIX52140.1 MAG: pilus assembly protein CpaF [Candidatus Aquicultor secundus]PIY39542.1 MAG: pilus assembly protein CpaF [Candidatus Aquicultor secundus]
MSLTDRLAQSANSSVGSDTDVVPARENELDELKVKYHYTLVNELGPELDDTGTGREALKSRVEQILRSLLAIETMPLSSQDKEGIIRDVIDNILGYGPIEQFLKDQDITEVMVNNADSIYIERAGKIYKTDRKFLDEDHLLRIIDKIVSQVGRRIDESSPMVDARLPDGSRVNAVIHPLAINGPMLTIRKFSKDPFTVDDLIRFETMNSEVANLLKACVAGRLNILVSGGTGTGKTTMLNVLSSFLPGDERIVTIEDSAELQLRQDHVLRLESRPANIEGKGEITIRDLVRNALRMRPDRIVIGEVRGGEALDMLQAMNTGHDGSLSTVHANSPRDVLSRVETMVLMSGFDLPMRAIREYISSSLNLIVHLVRLRDGSRRITQITEVQGMEGDTITLQDIFRFDFSMGITEDGRFKGRLKSTGIRPTFTQRLMDFGIQIPLDTFKFDPMARR